MLIAVWGAYTQVDNVVVKKQAAKVPPHTPSFCLFTKNSLGLEAKYEIKSYLAASPLLHRNHGCDSLGQSDQNENDPFSANPVLCEATEKHSARIHFF